MKHKPSENACHRSIQNLLPSVSSPKNLKIKVYNYIIYLLFYMGMKLCLSHTEEKHGLRVFENRVLRRTFGDKREEVVGGWRRLHNKELHNLYASPYVIRVINSRRMRWAGHVTRMGEIRNSYKILIEKPEGKRPLWRPRRRWEHNIRMDHREMWLKGVDWIHLPQDGDKWQGAGNTILNLRVS
jgi:hypothetical protein